MTFRIHSLTEPWQAQVCHDWGGDGPDGTGYGGGPTGGTGTGGIGRGDAGIGPGGGAAGTFGGFGFNGYMGQGLAQAMANIMGVNRNFNLPAAAPKVSPTTVAPKYKTVTTYTKVPVYKTVSVPTTQVATPSFNPSTLGVMTNPQVMHEVQKLVGYNNVPQSMRVAVAADQPTAGLALSQNLGAWANDKLSQNPGFNNYGSGMGLGQSAVPGITANERAMNDTMDGLLGGYNRGTGISFGASPKGDFMGGVSPKGDMSAFGPNAFKGDMMDAGTRAPSLNSFGLPAKDMGVMGVPGGMVARSQPGAPSLANAPALAAKDSMISNRESSPLGYTGSNPSDPGVAGVPGGLVARGTTEAQAQTAALANTNWGKANPDVMSKLMEAAVTKGFTGMFTSDALSPQQNSFVSAITPNVVQAAIQTNIDPRAILSQASLESAWGMKAPKNNLFGIKASPGWKGPTTTTATKEQVGPSLVNTTGTFRGYQNYGQSIADWANLMMKDRYTSVREANTLAGALSALGMSGYATDRNYANKLGSIANKFGNR